MTNNIKIHNQHEFESMRKVGALAAGCLDHIMTIKPGISTLEIDEICHSYQVERSNSAPLNYKGFPKSVCTSVNHVVCHGIPGNKILEEGDILNIDVTPKLNGWHGDTSRMFYVGNVKIKAKKLVETTYEAMMRGIEQVKPGNTTGDIGYAIQSLQKKELFSSKRFLWTRAW